ncbi:avidin/streptavidin family protein [Roseibium algae]|uniref:Avidin/streptavidin family protein n=1 Tax=Roseibium algae TaxID=3123038 RepID=A0ABU8TKS6_9HYPH
MIIPSPPASVDFNGTWENGLGSEMDLVVNVNLLSGEYRTNVGLPAPSEEFDLTGFVTGDLITFTVNFGRYGSLTTWAGQQTETSTGQVEIKTLWYLTKNVPDSREPNELWSSILAGAGTFTRP